MRGTNFLDLLFLGLGKMLGMRLYSQKSDLDPTMLLNLKKLNSSRVTMDHLHSYQQALDLYLMR